MAFVLSLFINKFIAHKLAVAFGSVMFVSLVSLTLSMRQGSPRVLQPQEVEVAFWAWNNETVSREVVDEAIENLKANTLFLRAGQFDYAEEKIRRIRAVNGKFPPTIKTHLVYNATSSLLQNFEKIETKLLAANIFETFKQDLGRAEKDGAKIAGLQLDFDVPTRLLPLYEDLLKQVRQGLPQDAQLSVTGLPTWMESSALAKMLTAVDFWIPQFYGAKIPETIDELIPIALPSQVASSTTKARRLGKPFYAGLPAYGYAILFDAKGKRIELRGDLSPSHVANNPYFELIERRRFPVAIDDDSSSSPLQNELRYVYRAISEGVIDGLNFKTADRLVLDIPTVETLRATSRRVREEAGEKLLGICVFRLPSKDDATNLTLAQIKSALNDEPSDNQLELNATQKAEADKLSNHVLLTATNTGTTSSYIGDDAFSIDLRVEAGSIYGIVKHEGFYTVESFCEFKKTFRPCSIRLANLVRFKSRSWMPNERANVLIAFQSTPPLNAKISYKIQSDDGRNIRQEQTLVLRTGDLP